MRMPEAGSVIWEGDSSTAELKMGDLRMMPPGGSSSA